MSDIYATPPLDPMERAQLKMDRELSKYIKETETDRDEWKRKALEAEEALKKAADILSDMIEWGRIDTEPSAHAYYVPEIVLDEIYAPLHNISPSDKNATA